MVGGETRNVEPQTTHASGGDDAVRRSRGGRDEPQPGTQEADQLMRRGKRTRVVVEEFLGPEEKKEKEEKKGTGLHELLQSGTGLISLRTLCVSHPRGVAQPVLPGRDSCVHNGQRAGVILR